MSNSDDIASHNSQHYDSVTDAWAYLLGENLHYGFFAQGVTTLDEATDRMVWEMAEFANMSSNEIRVIDVGCGIGNPAFLLHQKYGCDVTGITISPRGVELGKQQALQRGVNHKVNFIQADAMDNGLESEGFDLLWQMESSHLIHDKMGLLEENYRVIRPGGTLVLCDLFLNKELSVVDIYQLRNDLAMLEGSFGKAKMSTMSYYRQCMSDIGFQDIEVIDISDRAKPTLAAWKENVDLHLQRIHSLLSAEAIDDFLRACDILQGFFDRGLMGYGMIRATKPRRDDR